MQLSSEQEAPHRFCPLQKQQRCHAIGFTADQREGSIGGECWEEEEKSRWGGSGGAGQGGSKRRNGSLAALPDVSTFCVRARMD